MASSSQNQAQYLYKIGDYVYFETSATQPYQIRRIEELQKLSNSQVEAKVTCFYRRRDLSSQLLQLADKHHLAADGAVSQFVAKADTPEETSAASQNGSGATNGGENSMPPKQRHQLRHRELFMSRQVETLSATLIRGKCNVTLLNETELPSSYIQRGDAFYYRLVYDPDAKTLLADRGEIRVGPKYQVASSQLSEPLLTKCVDDVKAETPDGLPLELPIWFIEKMDDRQIEQFVTVAKSVGAYARALDLQSASRNSSLQLSAAAASRDVTLQTAMDLLHESDYKLEEALNRLLPSSGPLLCRDELEGWSSHEVQLFETALEKCGKNFGFIRSAYLPWKSLRSVIEYYYLWKTTDRYVQQRRAKAQEAARKLTAFYVAPFNKPSPALLQSSHPLNTSNAKPCESCCTHSSAQWYAFGPAQQTRICASCWSYWKRYGGLKLPTRLDGERPTPRGRQERIAEMLNNKTTPSPIAPVSSAQTSPRPIKTRETPAERPSESADTPRGAAAAGSLRANFCMLITPFGRLARVVCDDTVQLRKLARNPTRSAVPASTVKQALATHIDALNDSQRLLMLQSARDRDRERHSRAAAAVLEMQRIHPYYRASSLESADCSANKTCSLDSATKRCTRASPVKCAQAALNGQEAANGPAALAPAAISRRSASKLNAHAPAVKQNEVANGNANGNAELVAANGADRSKEDELRVGVSTTGITRKRVRDSLTSPNDSSPGRSRDEDAAKRPRCDVQLLVTKTDRGVNLRVVSSHSDSGNDLSAHAVLAKYRECIELVNEHERVVWEPSWYMLAMPLVRRARAKCVSAQQLRRLGRKWTQHTFDLAAASSSKTQLDTASETAAKSDPKWNANEHEPARLTALYD